MDGNRIEYIFTWYSLSDACPKCRSLNMREYRDQNIYQNTLWDVHYGDIWDLNADHSLTHPNCRCQLSVRAIIEPTSFEEEKKLLVESLTMLRQKIEQSV